MENTREDSITDDSYFTQWEREEPDQFNVEDDKDDEGHEIGPIHRKNPVPTEEAEADEE